jgi:hypothetical protein
MSNFVSQWPNFMTTLAEISRKELVTLAGGNAGKGKQTNDLMSMS